MTNNKTCNLLQDFMNEMFSVEQKSRLQVIEADPKKHKLTLVMSKGKRATYRYWSAGKDGRGWTVNFGYTCWRNAAGYFLSFRELIPPKGSKAKHHGKRDMFVARKVRNRAAAMAERRARKFKEKQAVRISNK